MAITEITLTANYLLLDGSPASGTVTFTLSAALENTTDNVIYPTLTYSVPLVNGAFSITLPSTNDSDTNPSGLSYTVVESISTTSASSAVKRTYAIELDHTLGLTQDLADLAPVSNTVLNTYTLLTTHTAFTSDLASTADSAKGAALVGYLASGTGAVGRTLHDRLGEEVFAGDYGVGSSETAANNTSRLQGLLDHISEWSALRLPPGTIQINDTLTLGYTQYKLIRGAMNGSTIIQQTTDNIPLLKATRKNTHNIELRDLTLAYASAQGSSNTAAYGLQWASEDSNSSGFYWWRLANVDFLNCYIGMGILPQSTWQDLVWGCDFVNLRFTATQHRAISMQAATAIGKPANRFTNIKIFNTNTSVVADGEAIYLQSGEATFNTLDIEGWYNTLLWVVGGGTCVVEGLHVESHTWNGTQPRSIYIANGPLSIRSAQIKGTASPTSGSARIFYADTGGTLALKDVGFSLTTTAGTTTAIVQSNSNALILDNVFNIGGAPNNVAIPSTDPTTLTKVQRWDDNFYGNGVIVGNGTRIKKHLSGTATWDPASTADGAMTSTTVTVTGAVTGDTVAVGFSTAVPAGCLLAGAVTAANTVTVTLFNKSGSTQDLASGTLRADIWQH